MEKDERLVVPRAGIEPATLRFSVAPQGEENQRDEAENAANRPIDNAVELGTVQNGKSASGPTPMDALRVIRDRENKTDCLSRYRDVASALGITEKEARELVAYLQDNALVYRTAAFSFETGKLVGSGFGLTAQGIIRLRKSSP